MQLKLDFHRNLQLWPIAATAWHVNCKCTNQLISVHWTFSLKIYNPCPSHLKSSFQYLVLGDHLVTSIRQFYLRFRPFFDLSQYFQSTMNRCLNQATQGHPAPPPSSLWIEYIGHRSDLTCYPGYSQSNIFTHGKISYMNNQLLVLLAICKCYKIWCMLVLLSHFPFHGVVVVLITEGDVWISRVFISLATADSWGPGYE